ncbi:hypothetical protein A2647_01885 [Candidatus Nomurabacteria bacterium RIFCSPHIGHO2_01_FULL_40_24b]|uniref:Aminoglycoside phosphotransferase domain-containing protein n=2 Tax=Parcubacteria group TaxID=1794811 RepID=A0A1F6V9R5_9BACT|nr:MAG: hypothetical protein A2647_01885 [Candidatus Nomurabacteria bacterium RIFCSPHIGHO2_01_FULL_40_24b]OHA33047.1 MAG: hypothetical protein A2928_00670 [Candidatus Taylorbacteria bacterium RIFCSPLOWO2_01_FULL_45_15b]
MTNELVQKICDKYLKSNFLNVKLGPKLSEFANTFAVRGDGNGYILKLITNYNAVSIIEHTKEHISALISISQCVNNMDKVRTISVTDFKIQNDHALFLIRKEHLKKLKIHSFKDFKSFGKSISNFHNACSSIKMQKLPWNNFPDHFRKTLKQYRRWDEVLVFLRQFREPVIRNSEVNCHNDIHAGNVFLSKGKVIFLDIDDMCATTYFNDLGMVIANFIDSNFTSSKILKCIRSLLTGYGVNPQPQAILNTLIFALRKLYFTEAYYLYRHEKKGTSVLFVNELQRRQKLIKDIMIDYL